MRNNSHELRFGKVKNKNYVFYLPFHSPFTIFAEKYCDAEYGNFKY